MAKITFIGLGNMGAPMATNLIAAGNDVTVFDLIPASVTLLVAQGAQTATSVRQAVMGADYIISMLPAGHHVESLYLDEAHQGENGLLAIVDAQSLVIDCSTIDSATACKVAKAAQTYGISMIDAPVSGGVAAATAATLTFMCGGEVSAFEGAKPVLQQMGKNIFHAGANGAGQVAKVCNNMLLSVLMIATSEALTLGVDNGLDPKVLSKIMLASSGRNWTLEVYNPYPDVMANSPASNDYEPGFMVDLMCKDLGLALQTAAEHNSTIAMGEMAEGLYKQFKKQGNGRLDFSAIIKSL